MKVVHGYRILFVAVLVFFQDGCSGQSNLFDSGAAVQEQDHCDDVSLSNTVVQLYSAGDGQTETCPQKYFAFGACGAFRVPHSFVEIDLFCPSRSHHQLGCMSFLNGNLSPVIGAETEWFGTSGSTDWAFCPEDIPVVTSRCDGLAGGQCRFPTSNDHGIRCKALSAQFYMKDQEEYECGIADANARSEFVECPYGYFAVGSCGSARGGPQCSSFGCSGTGAYTGLKCQQWGYLHSVEWDYSAEPVFSTEILSDINPIVGTISELSVDFETRAEASVSRSLDFNLEFQGEVGIEASILSLFGFPSLSGLFGGDETEFVEIDLDTTLNGEANFNTAAEAQFTAKASTQFFSYRVSSLDSWSENFVRFVHYKRKQKKEVVATIKCCNCDYPVTTVTTTFETSQTGYLALHVKSYPKLDLEQITGEEFVELYLNGTIVDFPRGPFRRFVTQQTFLQRMGIFLRGILGHG